MTLTVVRNSRPNLKKKFRDHCPPHRVNDIDALVKKYKGDERKIGLAIREWWEEEPERPEAEWQDVNKKNMQKHKNNNRQRRPNHKQSGRGGGGRGGGRGGAERRHRDYDNRRDHRNENQPQQRSGPPVDKEVDKYVSPKWNEDTKYTEDSKWTEEPKWTEKLDVGTVSAQDPTPAGFSIDSPTVDTPDTPAIIRPLSTGNVWATKGSAHLIQQEAVKKEKPRRKPQPVPPPPEEPTTIPDDTPLMTVDSLLSSSDADALIPAETALDTVVNGSGGSWNLQVEPDLPANMPPQQDIPSPEVVPLTHMTESIGEPPEIPIVEPVEPAPVEVEEEPEPEEQPPTTTVSMGRWDVAPENEDGLDFGFGSFGNDNEETTPSEPPAPIPAPPEPEPAPIVEPAVPPANDAAAALAASLSPPRPPPGLTITGMPPMPANAVSVHELEKNMESVSIKHEKVEPPTPDATSSAMSSMAKKTSSDPPPTQPQPPHVISTDNNSSSNSNNNSHPSYAAAYGMGMYNYNGGNGVMGIHAPNLLPQRPPKQPSTSSSQQPQHHALYSNTSNNNPGTEPTNDQPNNSPGIPPPGMPGMPYGMFYGQQYYQMGQPHGGYAGYGQIHNAGPGGFGYQQVPSGGYGQAAHYGDHGDTAPSNSSYKNNSSNTYRRGNAHHNSQYQNQYQGYGAQPYNMGYDAHQFRGGYVHDPYAMPASNYPFDQEEALSHKGRNKNNNNRFAASSGNPNMPQFQQGMPQGVQQGFGFQGSDSNRGDGTGGGGSDGGWSNPGWAGGASWQGN